MQINVLTILILCGWHAGCSTSRPQPAAPTCVQLLIDSAGKSPWIGTIEEYEFQGKTVYAIGPSSAMADGTTLVKTADCVNLCNIGGFAGPRNSNCNGDNFFEKAIFRRRVWERGK